LAPGKITAIVRDRRHPWILWVQVGLEDPVPLDEKVVLAFDLHVGMELDGELIERLGTREIAARAEREALRLATRRAYSIREMEALLRRKGYGEEATREALEKLESLGYLDDRLYAKLWVEGRMYARPMGRWRLKHELRQKGIDPDIVSQTLKAVLADGNETEVARKLARSWWERHHPASRSARGRRQHLGRLAAFLERRGFSHSTIAEVIRQLGGDYPDDDNLTVD